MNKRKKKRKTKPKFKVESIKPLVEGEAYKNNVFKWQSNSKKLSKRDNNNQILQKHHTEIKKKYFKCYL